MVERSYLTFLSLGLCGLALFGNAMLGFCLVGMLPVYDRFWMEMHLMLPVETELMLLMERWPTTVFLLLGSAGLVVKEVVVKSRVWTSLVNAASLGLTLVLLSFFVWATFRPTAKLFEAMSR